MITYDTKLYRKISYVYDKIYALTYFKAITANLSIFLEK